MKIHANAETCQHCRTLIVSRVLDDQISQTQVAAEFRVSTATIRRWLRRYRKEGADGLLDRSSAPKHVPRRMMQPAPCFFTRLSDRRFASRAHFAGGLGLDAARQYVDPVTFAEIHCALGEMDESLRWYEKAFLDRTPNMVYAAILPGISSVLADNPHYKAIVDRMGFRRPVTEQS